MKDDKNKKLVEQYLSKKASRKEIDEFFSLLNDNDEELLKTLNEAMDRDFKELSHEEEGQEHLCPSIHSYWVRRKGLLLAASILIFAVFSFYLLKFQSSSADFKEDGDIVFVSKPPDDGEYIELILPSGKSINLESDTTEYLSFGGKGEKGVYDFSSSEDKESSNGLEPAYQTIKTPAGKSIRLLLPDGSEVWLNASSMVRFPRRFEGERREVFAEGEVYFKVERDVDRPFIVNSDLQSVKVLGTEFNIDSYNDSDEVRTTLVSGEIEVLTEGENLGVSPGVQAVLNKKNLKIQSKKVDITDVTAWKDGFFRFNNIDIKTIMKQISRWYGINVKFQGAVSDDLFMGRFARNKSIEEFVEFLKKAKINAEYSDNTLIVKK